MDYGPDHCEEIEIQEVGELEHYRDSETVSWIDIQGLGDLTVLQHVGEMFSVHPLALEAAVNAPVRPRSEIYESNHMIVARMVRLEEEAEIRREQITFLVGERYLITIQERLGDVFDPSWFEGTVGDRFSGWETGRWPSPPRSAPGPRPSGPATAGSASSTACTPPWTATRTSSESRCMTWRTRSRSVSGRTISAAVCPTALSESLPLAAAQALSTLFHKYDDV
jgi:hypothetical protein